MSRFLSGYLRQIGWSFAAAVLLGGVLLLVMGELARIGALLAGAAAAALYFWQLAQRLLRASRGTAAAGRVQVQLGLVHDGRTAFLRGGRRVFPAARGDDDAADCPRDAFR